MTDEPNGLLDDDPALDCILYEEMQKKEGGERGRCGCLGLLILPLLPAGALGSILRLFLD